MFKFFRDRWVSRKEFDEVEKDYKREFDRRHEIAVEFHKKRKELLNIKENHVQRATSFTAENFKDLELITKYMKFETLDQTLNYLVAIEAIKVKENIELCYKLASL